jgi:hypothetical protein
MINDAVQVPEAAGANFTLMVQLPPDVIEFPQVLVSEKSPAFVPVTCMPVMAKVVFPVLLKVTFWDPLVDPTVWLL